MEKVFKESRFRSGNISMERESWERYYSRPKGRAELGYVLDEKRLAKPKYRPHNKKMQKYTFSSISN